MSCVGDKYNIDLAMSYREFKEKNRVTELSPVQVAKWMDAIINNYRFVAPVEEVMNFFHIADTPENRTWLEARKYTITGTVKQQDHEKASIMYNFILEVKESSIIL